MSDYELQLRISQESLEFALKSGRMGTWDINLVTDEVFCSPEMLDLWGVNPAEFKNNRDLLQSKVHPEDKQKMLTSIEFAIDRFGVYDCEYRIVPVPGVVRWVHSRGRRTLDPMTKTPVRFAGIVYDITEKKEKEESLKRAMAARQEFFTIAGHELKTPLTCLKLQLTVLELQIRDHATPELQEALAPSLRKQSEHLLRISRIVENILDETRISEGRMNLHLETFNLTEMVQEVLSQFQITADLAGVEVSFSTSGEILGNWDRFRLEQVLLNLLINALKYGEEGPIRVEVCGGRDLATFTVRDFGRGISAEDQPKIFQRFERAKEERNSNGLGLGLYISKNIVTAHGGDIQLTSEPGKGSSFTVVLPL